MKQLNWYQIFGNTHIIPDGKTVTPTDDIQTLLHCANIWDKSYTTIGEVIADDDTLFLTLIDNNAIDYLVRSTTFASSIVASESAMQYIGASDYASETLLSDSTWLTAIDGSAYKDYVINAKVPTMTDDTHPYGTASATNILSSSYPAYYAFDENDSTYWLGNSFPQTVYYTFHSAVNIYMFKYKGYGASNTGKDIALVNGDSGDAVVESFTTLNDGNLQTFVLSNPVNLAKCGLKLVNGWSGTANAVARKVQFYGRENAGVQTWLKAGGVEGKKYTTVSEVLSDLTTLATLMSSTDAIDYLVTAKGWATEICSDSNAMADIGLSNYASDTLLADETWRNAICNSTYFESVLNYKVPKMTSATTPEGRAFASSSFGGYPWGAFNGVTTSVQSQDIWLATSGSNQHTGYQFITNVKVWKTDIWTMRESYVSSRAVRDFRIEYSEDGVTWETATSGTLPQTMGVKRTFIHPTTANVAYWRLFGINDYGGGMMCLSEIQFYGRKDI